MVQPIPDKYHSVTPYLIVADAAVLIRFLESGFGGRLISSHRRPDGNVMHAEVLVGDSMLMTGSAPDAKAVRPLTLYLYVPDCDAVFQRAVSAGATPVSEPKTQFYGDRHGELTDPCGNTWWVASRVEDVSEQELARRIAAQR